MSFEYKGASGKDYRGMTPEQQDEDDRRVIKGDKDDSVTERIQRAKDAFRQSDPHKGGSMAGYAKAKAATERARRRYRGNRPSED